MAPKLIICIDGLGKDLISKENTPFLYSFGKENYFSELETMFAFTGLEYSFFSGKSPRELDIWLEFIRSKDSIFDNFFLRIIPKKLRDYFAVFLQKLGGRTWFSGLHNIPSDKLKYFDTSVKTGLWELEYFKDKNISFYKWPFFVSGKKEKIIFNYENDSERMNRLLSKRADIYYTQLLGVDKAIHKFGKGSSKTMGALRQMDETIRNSVEWFLDNHKDAQVFLWSDHGFANVKNYWNIEKVLPKRKDYIYFIAGTTVSFWFGNHEAEKEVKEVLDNLDYGDILDDKTAKNLDIPNSKKYGDLIFYVEKGNYFFPNFYQKSFNERFVAMHGYPNNNELNGFFISNKKIPRKLKFSEALKCIR